MKSCIYAGWVRHRRFKPVPHAFRYRIFMMYLELSELDRVFRGLWLWSARRPAIAWFRRRDHFGDPPAAGRVHPRDRGGTDRHAPGGRHRAAHAPALFRLLLQPGPVFDCHDRDGRLQDIVLEVNNTPWARPTAAAAAGRRPRAGESLDFEFAKAMHVSPFLPMDMRYRCRVSAPGEKLAVGIENWRAEAKSSMRTSRCSAADHAPFHGATTGSIR
jgi:DUF1365 family protein